MQKPSNEQRLDRDPATAWPIGSFALVDARGLERAPENAGGEAIPAEAVTKALRPGDVAWLGISDGGDPVEGMPFIVVGAIGPGRYLAAIDAPGTVGPMLPAGLRNAARVPFDWFHVVRADGMTRPIPAGSIGLATP